MHFSTLTKCANVIIIDWQHIYYGLLPFAGSDNHDAGAHPKSFGGIATEEPIRDSAHLRDLFLEGKTRAFAKDENGFCFL